MKRLVIALSAALLLGAGYEQVQNAHTYIKAVENDVSDDHYCHDPEPDESH